MVSQGSQSRIKDFLIKQFKTSSLLLFLQPGLSSSAMWEFWTSTPTPQRLQCLTYQVVRADKHVLPLPSPSSTYRFFKNKQPCFTFELDDEE